MAWRVSCAVLCATAMLERPTAKVSVAPMNSSAKPAAMRLEAVSEVVEEIVRAVMNTLRGDPLTSCCVAGLLTCGSLSFGGLPGFPVASRAETLSAHSCGGSHGFGPDWVILTVFPVRPEVRLAPGTTQSLFWQVDRAQSTRQRRRRVQKLYSDEPPVYRLSTF